MTLHQRLKSSDSLYSSNSITRRELLQFGAAGLVLFSTGAKAKTAAPKDNKKIVWVVLRGALDSLHAVPPLGDKHLLAHRAALVEPIAKKANKLERGFALHPSLRFCYQEYRAKHFLPIVAVATDYRERSHFDAQDVLESGRTQGREGWLARALEAKQAEAISVTQSLPLSLRGSERARTFYPSNLKEPNEDFFDRIKAMYKNDAALESYLKKGLEVRKSLENPMRGGAGNFVKLAERCGELLSNDNSAQCAMLELGGWDTHNAQVGRLERKLKELDQGLEALKKSMEKTWQDTVVIVATEFGRTVRVNGTQGTDHGTGASAWLLGGAVKGGRVLGDWPGLADDALLDNRDLAPTSQLQDWLATLLHQHWQLSTSSVDAVFTERASLLSEQLVV